MNIYDTFLKYTDHNGDVTYVTLYERDSQDQDSFQGDLDEVLYRKVGTGFGTFVPIDFNGPVGDTSQDIYKFGE